MGASHGYGKSNKRQRLLLNGGWVVLLLAMALALASWGSSYTCRGCAGPDVPGHVDKRFQYFNGPYTKKVSADAGQRLTMDYGATVEEGSLDMRVVNPDGQVVWQETYDAGADVNQTAHIDLQENGRYQLVVDGHQAKGNFQIDWQLN
ncbi:MAG: hypothetical protein P8X64_14820 [Anaerolineales bacterium]